MSASLEVIDFHGHWFPPELIDGPPAGLSGRIAQQWPLLADLSAQLELAAEAGTDVTVFNTPLSTIRGAAKRPFGELPARVNDVLAEAVRQHGPSAAALATVDAFAGEAGAEEARRGVEELGLAGIVVDAADGELLLAAPEARPTLEYAAEAGIAVFAHPVNPPTVPPRFAGQADGGILLARGTESSLSTLALLNSGVFDTLPGLRLVLAGIGSPAVLFAPFLPDAAAAARKHLFIDTMGFDPATARFLLDVLGPEHVLIGSDFPIMERAASRERVVGLLDTVRAVGNDRDLIAGGNARRLLRLPAPAVG